MDRKLKSIMGWNTSQMKKENWIKRCSIVELRSRLVHDLSSGSSDKYHFTKKVVSRILLYIVV